MPRSTETNAILKWIHIQEEITNDKVTPFNYLSQATPITGNTLSVFEHKSPKIETKMSFPTPDHAGGFTVIVTVTIQPDKVDEFLSHFYVAFEKVAAEPECLSFEVFRAQGEPNKIKWMESWSKSIEWFMQVRSR